nr:MAG TPA: hypothetical protein [Caudoviricetes sp.]
MSFCFKIYPSFGVLGVPSNSQDLSWTTLFLIQIHYDIALLDTAVVLITQSFEVDVSHFLNQLCCGRTYYRPLTVSRKFRLYLLPLEAFGSLAQQK